jgi:hypothetical protein
MIEEEEFQSQEMSKQQYMIDKHAHATTFGSKEVVKETVNEPSLEYHTLEMQTKKGETMVPFPNSSSLAAEPFIFNTHSSMPSSYNHPPQESLVQHFPTTHIDDLEERANQLMAVRHSTPSLLTLMHLLTSLMIAHSLFITWLKLLSLHMNIPKSPPHLLVRKKLSTRRNRKRSIWSKLSHCQIQIDPITRK